MRSALVVLFVALPTLVLVQCSEKSPPAAPTSDAGSETSDATRKFPLGDDADDPTKCPPLNYDAAGTRTLEDLPLAEMCAEHAKFYPLYGVGRWGTPCEGWIVIGRGFTDCQFFWLFDPTTHALVATVGQCNLEPAHCAGSIPGFHFPAECFTFDGSFVTNEVDLCPLDGGDDAGE